MRFEDISSLIFGDRGDPNKCTHIYIQVEPGKPGAEVSKKKNISQRKNLPIECAQGDQPLRCPNRVV